MTPPPDPDAAERAGLIDRIQRDSRTLEPNAGHCWTGLSGMSLAGLRSHAARLARQVAARAPEPTA